MKEEHLFHLIMVLGTLCKEKLFDNLIKYTFVVSSVHFLSFIISKDEVVVDPEKLKVIIEWFTLRTIHEVRSFYCFTTSYRRLVREFSTIIPSITDCLRKEEFQ